jgi:hypothetical protein
MAVAYISMRMPGVCVWSCLVYAGSMHQANHALNFCKLEVLIASVFVLIASANLKMMPVVSGLPCPLHCSLVSAVLPLTPDMQFVCGRQCVGCDHCWPLQDWIVQTAHRDIYTGAGLKKVRRASCCSCDYVLHCVFVLGEGGAVGR